MRKPADPVVRGTMLPGLSQETGAVLALLFILVPFRIGAMAALLLGWLKDEIQ